MNFSISDETTDIIYIVEFTQCGYDMLSFYERPQHITKNKRQCEQSRT